MENRDSHLSDQQLLLELDGELSAREARQVRTHLSRCWKCRTRRLELESAIADFVRTYQRQQDVELPSAPGPRALLRARLGQISATDSLRRPTWLAFWWAAAGAACGLLLIMSLVARSRPGHQRPLHPQAVTISVPDSRLTPGATLLASRQSVCSQANTNNKAVPAAVQRRVFEAYGIAGAEPEAYEVDYLITPALGGADDIHNLWPQSYSSTVWSAEVKDALEDRLRKMVCDGDLDLAEAQQNIAVNWVAAYKKYFNTDYPLQEHCKCLR